MRIEVVTNQECFTDKTASSFHERDLVENQGVIFLIARLEDSDELRYVRLLGTTCHGATIFDQDQTLQVPKLVGQLKVHR